VLKRAEVKNSKLAEQLRVFRRWLSMVRLLA
jgi:hypothetical protein